MQNNSDYDSYLFSDNYSFEHPSLSREGGLSEISERSDELEKAKDNSVL